MGAPNDCFPHYERVRQWLEDTPPEQFERKRREAELLFRRIGIAFSVYAQGGDPERLIPFGIIPRVLSGDRAHPLHEATRESCAKRWPPSRRPIARAIR